MAGNASEISQVYHVKALLYSDWLSRNYWRRYSIIIEWYVIFVFRFPVGNSRMFHGISLIFIRLRPRNLTFTPPIQLTESRNLDYWNDSGKIILFLFVSFVCHLIPFLYFIHHVVTPIAFYGCFMVDRFFSPLDGSKATCLLEKGAGFHFSESKTADKRRVDDVLVKIGVTYSWSTLKAGTVFTHLIPGEELRPNTSCVM